MAGKIKGITIAIDGETKGLDKALKDVDKTSKGLQTELNSVNRLLKFDPSNVEATTQKQKLLTEQVASTTKKLDALKQAQQEVNRMFADGEISDKEYREFRREVEFSEEKLKHLESQLRETSKKADLFGDKMKSAGDKVQATGDKMKGVGGNLSASVSLPILGVGAAALTVADQFDSAQGRIQAQLGLTADEADKLSDVAEDVWKNAFGESLVEVSDNLAIIKQNMGDLSDVDLKKVAEGAYTIKDAFGAEINETTRTASVLMKNFQIDSTEALDLITTGFQRGGNFSDELLDTLREYAPQFKGMGFEADEFTAILIAGAESGAFGLDKVGDAAKEAFLRIGDGSKGSRDALGNLGLDFQQIETDINSGGESAKSSFAAVVAAIATVKDPAEKAQMAVALLGTPIEDLGPEFQTFFANVSTDLGNVEGATVKAGDALYDNFGSRATGAFREFQSSLEPLGAILLNMVENILPKVVSMIESVTSWFEGLSDKGQKLTVAIGLIAAAIGPLLVVFGFIASAIGSMIGLWGTISLAIANAGGATVVLGSVFAALTGPVAIVIAAIVAIIAVVVLAYKKIDWFREGVNKIWEIIKQSTKVAFAAIKETINNIVSGIVSFVKTQLDKFKSFWDENGKFILATVKTAFGQIKSNIELVMGIIKGIFQIAWPLITATVRYAWETIKLVVSTAIDIVLGVIQTVMKILQGDWKGAWDTIIKTLKDIWAAVGRFLEGIDLAGTGKNIIQGLINGIGSMASAVQEKVRGIVDGIKSAITGALKIKSPSRVTMEYGVNVGQGLVNGIEKMNSAVKKSATQMANSANPGMSGAKNVTSSVTNAPVTNIYATIEARSIKELNDVVKIFNPRTMNAYGMG